MAKNEAHKHISMDMLNKISKALGYVEYADTDRMGFDADIEAIAALIESEKAAFAHQLKSTGPEDAKSDPLDNDENKAWVRGYNENGEAWRAHIDAVLGGGGTND